MHELRDLFTVSKNDLASSQTQRQLSELHAHQREATDELKAHLLWLQSIDGFAGELLLTFLFS